MFHSIHGSAARYDPKVYAGLACTLLAVLVIACFAGTGALRAAGEKLPKGEKICDRYIEVTGGVKAYDKINNRVSKSTIDIPSQGMKLSMAIYAARPNRLYSIIESDVIGKMEKGISGDVVWEKSIMTGPVIKEGSERTQALQDATFDRLVHWRKIYKEAECVGVDTIAGRPCYKVVMTPKEGSPSTFYYEKESHLLAKVESVVESAAGRIPTESFLSDYREVDGIMIAHKITMHVMGQERVITVQSIENNVEMPQDRFMLPEDIKALVDKKKSEEAGVKEQ